MNRLKVLLITPNFSLPGGVSEYNRMLLQYSKHNLSPFFLRSVSSKGSDLKKIYLTFFDYLKFVFFLSFKDYDIIHVNPSLRKNSILRDSLFVWMAKLFNKKVIIQWHGWNPKNEFLLKKHYSFLNKTMFKADHIRFLSAVFRDKFRKAGFNNKVSIGNTFIDDRLLKNNKKTLEKNMGFSIIFLSTVSKNKGIFLVLDIFKKIIKKYPETNLIVAGIGDELEKVKEIVNRETIPNVKFLGYVSGDKKSKAYRNADVYLFPSFYEGMPTSVLEAMGLGLPIVCSSVGAIPDFFKNGKMGFMIDDQIIIKYVEALDRLICDKNLRLKISDFNKKYALNHFTATKSIEEIDKVYRSLTDE